jgi:hypothetical protein
MSKNNHLPQNHFFRFGKYGIGAICLMRRDKVADLWIANLEGNTLESVHIESEDKETIISAILKVSDADAKDEQELRKLISQMT